MAGEGQSRFLPLAFAGQLGFRIGRRFVGVVAPLLPFEVGPGVTRTRALVRALRFEALEGSPGLDQGAIDREVIIGDPAVFFRQRHHLGKEQVRHLMAEQSLLVLTERRRVEDRFIQRQVEEPAEHQIGLEPGAQLPVTAHREERLQDQRLDPADRVVGRNQRFDVNQAHKTGLGCGFSSHM